MQTARMLFFISRSHAGQAIAVAADLDCWQRGLFAVFCHESAMA
jgi:hypothetical protein